MKKISIVLLLSLALVFTLTACNNTPVTHTSPRWENSESYTFTIKKAIVETSDVTHNDATYIREPGVTNYEPDVDNMDEIVPEDVSGTYVMSIAVDSVNTTCTFKTSQTLYVSYPKTLLESSPIWNTPDANGNKLSDKVVPQDSEENPFEADADLITLKSITETEVVFRNDSTQRPISSKNHVDGFYIGKTAQTISKYDLATTYEFNAKNKVTITVNGETMATSGVFAEKFIDANQLLLYVRSLDKSTTSFQDSPSVTVYMPKVDENVMATFVFSYTCNTVVEVAAEEIFVKVNAVGVIVNSNVLLMQLNVPDTVNSDSKYLDSLPNAGSGTSTDKYSTVRFRSGVYSYWLTDFSSMTNGSKILEAISA